ncbi:phosphoglucomutase-2 [Aureobasidium namibiae CBS 147.97]|uniref:phosphopentomutase n=1 Tax=Aureobasidium namibiae CBS 147.97 TaxID=1043004 RepID=A0A074WJE6_9PEZI
MNSSLQTLVDEWLRLDQDASTRSEIEKLVAENNTTELQLRLGKRIAFGTAGLRGRMEAGFSRMNSLTVIQASQGLAEYLLKANPDTKTKGVVIGRDARHNSDKFAKLVAAVFVAKAIPVKWLGQVHTPLVPYTVGHLGAAAGIMITASHNPAADNGYKVYWGNGCQIIPPHDAGIAASIDANLEPITWDVDVLEQESALVIHALQQVEEGYMATVSRVASVLDSEASLPFVYTPMHGVGLPFFTSVMKQLGLESKMHIVKEQAHPDPDFPTVRFPNPEEKGALDLAKQVADQNGVKLILANDPDADRFAAAEKVDGEWRQLTGNQMGVLLASHVLDTYQSEQSSKGLAMLSSTVSSKMLAAMAAASSSFHWEETLTGFKWLGNRSRDLQSQGYDALFAYEEAIGYMFSEVVFDKDGVAAAAVFLAACDRWNKEGLSPWTKYNELCKKYGYFEDANIYVISPSSDITNAVFEQIRQTKPTKVGSRSILRWRDLTIGYDSATPDNKPTLPVDKSSQMISCELDDNVHFTVRGSGTEPKIKFYIEGSASTSREAKSSAQEVLEDLMSEWFKPEVNGLKRE